jgi:MFS family permease
MEAPPVSHKDDADRPATFREVLASGEYRALYLASVLSWFGDYVARAAVTALVYQETRSVAASAATFAISYLPWLGFGPILAALAERLPYRRTMIVADVLRMVLIALVALPSMPVWGMITLLFATSLCNPPFDAARSALLAKVLDGDRYVVGLTLHATSHQIAQIVGYVSGAGLSAVDPQAALLFNAATFGISACLIGLSVHPRPPALAVEDRTDLLHETASGLRLVFGSRVLRAVAITVFLTALFAVVPEGLAAGWAATLAATEDQRGWVQGAIMISNPVGFILGGVVVARLFKPTQRQRVIPIFAIAVPATLAPAVFNPAIVGVTALSFACGVASAGLLPATNGLFVQALPNAYRARAFGVMKGGIQVLQGAAVFITGALADRFQLSTVVGAWGIIGIALMAVAISAWPDSRTIGAEIDRVQHLNAITDAAAASSWRAPSPGPPTRHHPGPPGSGTPGGGLPDGVAGGGLTGTPGAGLPGVGVPGAGLPGAGVPGGGLPGAGLPGADSVPGGGVPGAGAVPGAPEPRPGWSAPRFGPPPASALDTTPAAGNGPADGVAIGRARVDNRRVDSGWDDGAPVNSGPVDADPVNSGPVDNGLVNSGPVDNGPVDNGPHLHASAEADADADADADTAAATGDKAHNGRADLGAEQHPSPRPRPGRHRAASV